VLAMAFLAWTQLDSGNSRSLVAVIVAAVALVAALVANQMRRVGWSFALSGIAIVATVAMFFLALFPNVMPSSLNAHWDLTVSNASSSPYTLKIMTWCAGIAMPIIVLYQGWTYWVFRKRIGTQHIAPEAGH